MTKKTKRAKSKPKTKAKKAVGRKSVSRAPKARTTAKTPPHQSSRWPGLPPGYFDRAR
jgi:hypothetical protein